MALPNSRSQIMIALAKAEAQLIHVHIFGRCIDGILEVLIEDMKIL